MFSNTRTVSRWCAALASGAVLTVAVPALAVADTPQITVKRAEVTLEAFKTDPRFPNLARKLERSRAVMIVPEFRRGGIGIGGEGGIGVLLKRNAATGKWSYPAFFSIGGVSVGPQIGFESGEMLIVINDPITLRSIMTGSFTINADASVIAGGADARGMTSTTAEGRTGPLVLLRSRGAYAGATLGAIRLSPKEGWNAAYYHRKSTPLAILGKPGLSNPMAEGLRQQLHQLAERDNDTARLPPS